MLIEKIFDFMTNGNLFVVTVATVCVSSCVITWAYKKYVEDGGKEEVCVEQPKTTVSIPTKRIRTFVCSHCGADGNEFSTHPSQTLRMRLQLCNKCMKEVRFK